MNGKKELYQVEFNPFNSPLNAYIKLKLKMKYYEDLKGKSTIRYYGLISKKLAIRYVKKDLGSTLMNMLLFMFAFHFAENSGFIEYMMDRKDRLYILVERLYKFLFRLK
jgi:hypothetical protein